MIFFLKRVVRQALRRKGASLLVLYVLLLLFSSLLVMAVEPAESPLKQFANALWWAVVTSTTVGYGDLYPLSIAGRLIAVFLPMFLGIGISAAFITYLASIIIERRDRRMTGEIQYKGSGHIVVVGATEETALILSQLLQDDGNRDVDIVLAADIGHHPMPDQENVIFVKGKAEAKGTLLRAGIGTARRVVIHTGSDEDSLFALVNVLKLKDTSCDVTVMCLSSEALQTFSSVPGKFEIIVQMTAELLVQAMQNKAHLPLQILLTYDETEEIYFVTVPQLQRQWTFWELHKYLKEQYDFLAFAVQTDSGKVIINPARDLVVAPHFGIWLMARTRPVGIDWNG